MHAMSRLSVPQRARNASRRPRRSSRGEQGPFRPPYAMATSSMIIDLREQSGEGAKGRTAWATPPGYHRTASHIVDLRRFMTDPSVGLQRVLRRQLMMAFALCSKINWIASVVCGPPRFGTCPAGRARGGGGGSPAGLCRAGGVGRGHARPLLALDDRDDE